MDTELTYQQAWQQLREHLEQEANASGAMMSMAEWAWSTRAARDTLALMSRIMPHAG